MFRTSTSRAMVLRPSTPTIRLAIPRQVSAPIRRVKHRRTHKKSGHIDLTTAAIAGAAIGMLGKMESLPTIAGIGKQGTIGLLAYFLSKQGGQVGQIARVVCVVCVAGAAKNLIKGESIEGDEDAFATV